MTTNNSLQIQAILYHNDPEALTRAADSILAAVRRDKANDHFLGTVTLAWGDASASPVFTEEQINALRGRLGGDVALRYEYFNENTGYGKGHNLLFEGCDADYLMVENPDIVIAPDYFHFMLSPFDDPEVGLTEARQTPIEHPKKYDPETLVTPWSSGACFVIGAPLFRKLEGFDDVSFFMYSEDVDLSLRIRREGLKLIYQPAAPVYHAKSLNKLGQLEHTKTELRHSAEAQIVLAYKWNQPQTVARLISAFEGGTALQKEAVASFKSRKRAGQLLQVTEGSSLYNEKDYINRFDL